MSKVSGKKLAKMAGEILSADSVECAIIWYGDECRVLTGEQIKMLCASVLSQAEDKPKKPRRRK